MLGGRISATRICHSPCGTSGLRHETSIETLCVPCNEGSSSLVTVLGPPLFIKLHNELYVPGIPLNRPCNGPLYNPLQGIQTISHITIAVYLFGLEF